MVEEAVRDARLLGDVADARAVVAAVARRRARRHRGCSLRFPPERLNGQSTAPRIEVGSAGVQPLAGHPRRRLHALPPRRVREPRAPASRRARRARRGRRKAIRCARRRPRGTPRCAPEPSRSSAICKADAGVRASALRPRRRRARGLPAGGRRRGSASGPTTSRTRPSTARSRASARRRRTRARRPRSQLPRLGGRARGHRAGTCRRSRSPTSRRARSARSTQVLAALLERERTGSGARIVVSMTHGSHDLVAHRLGGEPVPRMLTGGLACYRIYATADGRHLTVGALEPKFFARLCELLGRPELAERQYERRPGGARGRSSPRSSRRGRSPTGSRTSTTRTCASARSPLEAAVEFGSASPRRSPRAPHRGHPDPRRTGARRGPGDRGARTAGRRTSARGRPPSGGVRPTSRRSGSRRAHR